MISDNIHTYIHSPYWNLDRACIINVICSPESSGCLSVSDLLAPLQTELSYDLCTGEFGVSSVLDLLTPFDRAFHMIYLFTGKFRVLPIACQISGFLWTELSFDMLPKSSLCLAWQILGLPMTELSVDLFTRVSDHLVSFAIVCIVHLRVHAVGL